MLYRVIAPSPDLARYIQCHWTLSGRGEGVETVFPDGRPDLVFHFGDRFARVVDGQPESQPLALFAGQLQQPIELVPSARTACFGVRFRPAGAARFFRFPQYEVAGSILALDDIWPAARSVRDRLASAASDEDRVRIAENALRPLLDHRVHSPVDHAVEAMVRSRGTLPVEQAAAAAGLSRRTLERQFYTTVGLSPKVFARVLRFQQALALLQARSLPVAGIALECGFYDQSHMIHEFRAFAGGLTPVSWSANGGVAFLQDGTAQSG